MVKSLPFLTVRPGVRGTASLLRVLWASVVLMHFTNAALADMSAWSTNEGGRMRLVVLPPDATGKIRGALQIEPKPGWITYWKEPGDTGIPPQISFGAAPDISLDRLSYPVPKRIDNGALRDIGYDQPVALPFELTARDPTKPITLTASAFIGLCRNICIPFQAEFTLPIGPTNGTPAEEAMIIARAEALLPEPPSESFAVTHYVMTQGGDVLRLTLQLPEGAPNGVQVIVSGPQGHVLLDGINAQRTGNSYTLDMPIGKLPKGYDIKGKRWGILAISGSRAMETSLAFD
jgi:DsbC/DsbD-like thiol-disulfide interchange protein